MGTPFAVASERDWKFLGGVGSGTLKGWRDPWTLISLQISYAGPEANAIRRAYGKGWIEYVEGEYRLTDAGRVAFELAEALGPNRELTKAGARALLGQIVPDRRTREKLARNGLMTMCDELTEDGVRVVHVLRKYRVEL